MNEKLVLLGGPTANVIGGFSVGVEVTGVHLEMGKNLNMNIGGYLRFNAEIPMLKNQVNSKFHCFNFNQHF